MLREAFRWFLFFLCIFFAIFHLGLFIFHVFYYPVFRALLIKAFHPEQAMPST